MMNEEKLRGRKIVVGVTGGIAAYKAVEVVRGLKKLEAQVIVVMTQAATEFVRPLTFETLSGNEVAVSLFPNHRTAGTRHVSLADWAELVLVAPATANIIGKVASGIADDLLSTLIMATTAPVIFAPAMDTNMLSNPITAGNIEKLRGFGYGFIGPESGYLASGKIGRGRLAEPTKIVDVVVEALASSDELSGRRVLVTAGRTEEDIDPVRFLTNRSTGKMGYALAECARRRGAVVCLISGPSHLAAPRGVRFESVRTAEQMRIKVEEEFERSDMVIMAAAVSDFRPKRRLEYKLKKGEEELVLELEPTVDILAEIGRRKGDRILVGFALETGGELEEARRKREEKNLDLIVLNNPLVEGAGFGTDTNIVTIISRDGEESQLPELTKFQVAEEILDRVVKLRPS